MKGIPIRVAALLLASASAHAQTTVDPQAARVEVEVGGGLFGGARLGAGDANLRANAQARQPFRLFATESRLAGAPLVYVRAAVPLGRGLGIEGGVALEHPEVRTSLTADAEGAAGLTAVERIDQYAFDAGVVWRLDRLRIGGRLFPFVSGGAGYLRQLHEGRTLIEHGQVYHVGGGVKYWLLTRPNGFLRSAGLKGDVRMQLLRGGIAFEDRARPHAAMSGGVFVGF
jgi:hypothetical protein